MALHISNHWLKQLRADLYGLREIVDPRPAVEPGLYAFPVELPDGRQMRLHLRIEPGGQGVLFVDVTDVVHLNQSAAEIALRALQGVSQLQTQAEMAVRYPDALPGQLKTDIKKIYQVIGHFYEHTGNCFTCALHGLLDMQPLFSVPVNAPYKVDLALTYGCNNGCPHCYNEAGRLGMPSLPLGEWRRVLDKIAELGVPHVILTGGEATLHPDLPEIIQYADGLGMIVGLNTNGRHLGHESYMQRLAAAGLNHVQVTLGSHLAELHNRMMGANSFDQTVRGIEAALQSGVHVITNSTLMRSTMQHAEALIDFLHELGIRTFAMNGMIYSGGGFAHPEAIPEEDMPPLLVRVRDHAQSLGMRFLWYTPTEYCRLSPIELEVGAKRCNAGEYSLCIEPNGDVLPCQSYYVAAGNILHDPWEQIWQGELFRSFREREADPAWAGLPEKCWECPDLAFCGGGCRIEREAREGIRVADAAGGGCGGCAGSCGTGQHSAIVKGEGLIDVYIPSGGYVPPPGQTSTHLRTSGNVELNTTDEVFD